MHTIPIYDPVADQANATIERLEALESNHRPDYAGLPHLVTHTSGSTFQVREAINRNGLEGTILIQTDFDMPHLKRMGKMAANRIQDAAAITGCDSGPYGVPEKAD